MNSVCKHLNLADLCQLCIGEQLERIGKNHGEPSRAARIRSLMEDSGFSRRAAAALVDAGMVEP